MAYQVQVTGEYVIGNLGGPTPNEMYGEGVFGPAVFGPNNTTGLPDNVASSYEIIDAARVLEQVLRFTIPGNQYKIVEVESIMVMLFGGG